MLIDEIQRDLAQLDGSPIRPALLSRLRKELGLTQREMADTLCISQGHLAQCEGDKYDKTIQGPAAKLLRFHARYATVQGANHVR